MACMDYFSVKNGIDNVATINNKFEWSIMLRNILGFYLKTVTIENNPKKFTRDSYLAYWKICSNVFNYTQYDKNIQ